MFEDKSTPIYICTQPRRQKAKWVCVHSNIMIYYWTTPWCTSHTNAITTNNNTISTANIIYSGGTGGTGGTGYVNQIIYNELSNADQWIHVDPSYSIFYSTESCLDNVKSFNNISSSQDSNFFSVKKTLFSLAKVWTFAKCNDNSTKSGYISKSLNLFSHFCK